jgi:hypothetical protein
LFQLAAGECVAGIALRLVDASVKSAAVSSFHRNLTDPAFRIQLIDFRIEHHADFFPESDDARIVETGFKLFHAGLAKQRNHP